MRMSKQTWAAGAVGLVVGAAAILGIRFATYNPEHVHYHAYFAVYINGQREAFKSPLYYEEKGGASCTVEKIMTPAERVHMHEPANDVVHVHDHAVTWGQFFENLHWAVADSVIKTPGAVYLADDTHRISYILNGHAFADISTETIHDQDRLLVDYGDTSDTALQQEFKQVAHTAHQYDVGNDPAACKGDTKPTLSDRLRHLF